MHESISAQDSKWEHIHEHAAEMRRYYQDIEERTAAEKAQATA